MRMAPYAHTPRENRIKLDLKTKKCYFLGYQQDQVDEHDNEGDVYALIIEEGEPSSFEEAQNFVDKAEWTATMRKEMKSLNDNKTWELVELRKDKQMDVVIAFFYGVLDEEIFMRQPPGFARKGHESLDLGFAKKILGMDIHMDVKGGRLWLTQGKYARKVLERFNMLDAKPIGTSLANHFKHQLSIAFCPLDAIEKGLMSKVPYESVVGNLMYLMVCTRPDIAYALGKVSKYNANPRKVH
ncbi:hypothetical protein R1flu_000830 [Riccia fluitans]|uniref:Retroviral polymerase SH3-like domain-containing protein n=1 Tax=Riccia fluitans TaxID=41844 RepID=A0ABD1Y1J6_9MARC